MYNELFAEAGFSLDRCCAFLAIVEAGGISQAASGNPTRQSQLSRQLGELETWMGTKLTIRGRGRFGLTETGKGLVGLLNSHFSSLQHLKASCANESPILRIGSGESLLQWFVIPSLALLNSEGTRIQSHLSNFRSESVIAGLLDGALELGVLRHGNLPKRLKSVRLTSLHYGIFTSKSLKKRCLEAGEPVPLALLESGSHLDDVISNMENGNVNYEVQMRCSSLAQAAEAVRQGLSAAILPRLANFSMPASVQFEPIPDKSPQMELWLAWEPRNDTLIPKLGSLRTRFVACARKFLKSRELIV